MKYLYEITLKRFEKAMRPLLLSVSRDPNSLYYGKSRHENGLYETGNNLGYIERSALLYLCPDSVYYKDQALLDLILLLCEGLKDSVHEDGTDDLAISNFHQPELFNTPCLCVAYRHLNALPSKTEKEQAVVDILYNWIGRFGEGLLSGGFHTPNHRWVLTSALFYVYNTLGAKDERYVRKASKFLAEKIDIDENGEFSERSAGMYSAVSDKALCEIAVEASKPELFDLVKRNLFLVYRYLEKGHLIFTQNSRRKDKGEVGSDTLFGFDKYADICLIAYANTGDLTFLQILDSALKKQTTYDPPQIVLRPFFDYPELRTLQPDFTALPSLEEEFHAFYPDSNIVRVKKNGATYSLLAGNPNFLYITAGNISIQARMCSSFFAKAQFIPDMIEKLGETTYRMHMHTWADYKLPFDNPPEGSEHYWSMDYQSRESTCRCDYGYTVDFTFTDNGINLRILTEGTEKVPFKLEFITDPGVFVRAGDAMTKATEGNFLCAAKGDIRICNTAGDHITIKGAFAEHFYHKDMRGSIASPANKFMLYLTGFSPIDKTIDIVCEKDHPWDYFESK